MIIEDLLRDAISETGIELRVAKDEAIQLVAAEAARLTLAIDEPGFHMALRASRDRVALELGVDASMQARAADARIVGIIQSVLLGLAS